MYLYKNAPIGVLRLERHDLCEQYRAWGAIYAESDRFETHQANEAVGIIGRAIRERIEAIDAELATWTAPLPDIHDAPTAIAS